MLSIVLFGSPQLCLDRHPVPLLRRKNRALVYYLAEHPEPVRRERLLTLLWPEHERAAAQHSLRTMLHGLRQTLGPALIVTDETLALEPGTEVDVRTFATDLARPPGELHRLQATLTLYRGDFLADFTLPDSPAFDDWVVAERERYRQLAVRALTTLAQQHAARTAWPAALTAITRAIDLDPLREDVQSIAMQLQYLSGDRTGAIRRYEQLRKLLDDELGLPPMAETRAAYDAIITERLQPDVVPRAPGASDAQIPARSSPVAHSAGALTDELPFTGRAAEIELLQRLATGRHLLLVDGASGVGKTRLVAEVIRRSNALALTGAAHELERSLPYQPVREALRGLLKHPDWPALQAQMELPESWLSEVGRLVPELAPPSSELPAAADEARLWEGIAHFLRALARQRSLLLALDDLQWADEATLGLLGYLLRHREQAPIAVLATAQPVDPRSPLAGLLTALTREGRLRRLTLAPLSSADTAALAAILSPSDAAPLADWLQRTADGNPYVLAELVREAREAGLLRPDGSFDATALTMAPLIPETVYSVVQARLVRLSDAARRLLGIAAAAGQEWSLDVVARAAALPEDAALDALDELRAAHLVRPRDELRYTFDHALTLAVALSEVGAARLRLLHRRLAEALEELHPHRLDEIAGLLATHFAAAHLPMRAAPYAFRAGQRAARLAAWRQAITLFEQALAGSDEPQRLPILMALGEVCYAHGDAAQASVVYQQAVEAAVAFGDGAALDTARLRLGRTMFPQARYAEAIALARAVRADGRPESAIAAEVLWGSALLQQGLDLPGAAEHLHWVEQALARAERVDDDSLASAMFELGGIAALQGDLHRAVDHYRRTLQVAEGSDLVTVRQWAVLAYNNLAYHLHLLGDPDARSYAEAGLRLAEAKGPGWGRSYLHSTLGEIALAVGDVDAAERHFTAGLVIAEQRGQGERIAGLTANLGLVALQRGQRSLALERLSTARVQADELGAHHLAAQICLWLVPLLPIAEAWACLAQARAIAEAGQRRRLLDDICRLEAEMEAQTVGATDTSRS